VAENCIVQETAVPGEITAPLSVPWKERERETEYYGTCYNMTVIKAILHFRNRHIFAYSQNTDEREREREREREQRMRKFIFQYIAIASTVTKSMTCPVFMIQTVTSHVLVSF